MNKMIQGTLAVHWIMGTTDILQVLFAFLYMQDICISDWQGSEDSAKDEQIYKRTTYKTFWNINSLLSLSCGREEITEIQGLYPQA